MMIKVTRRSAAKFLALAPVGAATMTGLALPAAAQTTDLYVPTAYQNFKRGTIHSLDPSTRGLVVIWSDEGRVKMKASSYVSKTTSGGGAVSNAYEELKVGQIVDIQWFDYLDFLVAKTTAESTAQAKAMVAKGASIEGMPGSAPSVRLFSMAGMVVKTYPDAGAVDIINAIGGEPDVPPPNSGEVIRLPQIRTAPGRAALAQLKVGDGATFVYSVQTAFKVHIIR
jgi:hypothetical protein